MKAAISLMNQVGTYRFSQTSSRVSDHSAALDSILLGSERPDLIRKEALADLLEATAARVPDIVKNRTRLQA
jgi:hypothetical protein